MQISRVLFSAISILFLSHVPVFGQVLVGKYHLYGTNRDYAVLVDDMQNRYKGKSPQSQLKKYQIYLQVECDDNAIEAFIKLSGGKAHNFSKELFKKFSNAQKYAQTRPGLSKPLGDGEVDLYMKWHDSYTGTDFYGYESGLDYDIICERSEDGQFSMSYIGEEAMSEGEDGISIRGWTLTLSSVEEIQAIDDLIKKAQTMIRNNNPNL